MSELIFEEDGHRYSVARVVYPSITQILRAVQVHRDDGSIGAFFNYSFLSDAKSEDVLARGSWIADLCAVRLQRINEGPFRLEFLDILETEAPDWFPYYPPFERWLARELAQGFAPIYIERPLYSPRYGYAGRPDLVCVRMGKRPSVVELKTGDAPEETSIQTMLQEILVHEQPDYPYRGQSHDRFALELNPDHEAVLIPYRNNTGDRALAMAVLALYRHHCPNGASNGHP